MISAKCPDWNSIPEMGYPWKGLSSGITAKTDVDLIERRLKTAKTEYEAQYGPVKQKR
jgi:hypothetical protein